MPLVQPLSPGYLKQDDLIIEVGRILQPGRLKGQLAIRALFIAPPDAIAQRLSGTMVLPGGTPAAAAAANPANAKPKN
jgi:hypothetical protein